MSISMKNFITDNEVVFIGLSSNPESFSREVYQNFVNAGFKVYPVNERGFHESGLNRY